MPVTGSVGALDPQAPDSTGTTSGYPSWEYALIQQLGGTPNPVNLKALYVWSNNELGRYRPTNNWLAISSYSQDPNMWGRIGTMKAISNYGVNHNDISPGIWNTHPGGVLVTPTYASESEGVNATAAFMQAGHQDLINALIDPNASLGSIAHALRKDGGWAYSDVVNLYQSANMPVPISGNGGATGPNGDASVSTFTQCDSTHVIVGSRGPLGIGSFNILNACQAKAIVGGLIVAVGGIVMWWGIAVIIAGKAEELTGAKEKAQKVARSFPGVPKTLARSNAANRPVANNAVTKKAWEEKYGMPWEESYAGKQAQKAQNEARARARARANKA